MNSEEIRLAIIDLANIAYQDGREEKSPWSHQWQKLEDRICAMFDLPADSEGQREGAMPSP